MLLALKEAKKAYFKNSVPIGCVIVNEDNEIVSKAHNGVGLEHAELLAIKQAIETNKDWRLTNLTIYVTIEPCLMCIGAILNSRISRVVYGSKNKKYGSIDSLLDIRQVKFNHHIQVTSNFLENECNILLKNFFNERR